MGTREIVNPLFELETELRIAVQNYLRASNPTLPTAYRESANKRLLSKRDVMYDDMTDDDAFRKDYQSALTPIEDFLRAKLGKNET